MRSAPAEVLVPRPDNTPAWRDAEQLALPLPPAPPGERGYRPGDVERFTQLLADMLDSTDAPDPGALADLKLSRTFFVGQGYHVGVVDAMKTAWLEELHRREL
jgi:hypothetical protein